MSPKFSWKKLVAAKSAAHGSPCTRSSHGISYIHPTAACPNPRLIVYGGETVARTPLDASQATWACDLTVSTTDAKEVSGMWRLITSTPPPLRVAHAQAFHEPSLSLYVFGGRAGITMQEQAMNDLWKLDCSGSPGSETWSQVKFPDDTAPEARSFHKMVCLRDSLYVFGGCGATSGRLADMHRFDLNTKTWQELGSSGHLRGRGGANLLVLDSGRYLGVVAGFAGEETNDGHLFDVENGKWCEGSLSADLEEMRPRSVCLSGSFPSLGVSVIFGGEVDPSAKGHEGAGSFDNSIVLLDEKTGEYLETISPTSENDSWPQQRGWSDGAATDSGNGNSKLFFFGGLSGDDVNPVRLDDMWVLDFNPASA